MFLRRRVAPSALLVFAAAAACSPPPVPDPEGRVEVARQPIIGGVASTAAQDAVVRLTVRTTTAMYECTGTLVAPNLVLTARHCVSQTSDGGVGCTADGVGDAGGAVQGDYDPTQITVRVGAQPARGMRQDGGAGDAGVRPHGLKIFHDDAKNLCNHDLALLMLDTTIAGALIAPLRLEGPPVKGEPFTAVGWGVTDSGSTPSTRQQRAGLTVGEVGPYVSSEKGDVAPNEFMVGESICSGDSGGPALARETGAVLGVVSRGGNGTLEDPNDPATACTGPNATNIYTEVAPFKDLILQAFGEAGQDPWLEGGPDPRLAKFGGACLASSDCRSSLCFTAAGAAGGGGVCTSSCADAACPTGFDCAADGALGSNVCQPHVDSVQLSAGGGCSSGPRSGSRGGSAALMLLALALIGARRARRKG